MSNGSNESNTLTISRTYYNYARWGLIIFVIAFLIAIYKISQGSPNVTITLPKSDPVIADGKNMEFSDAAKAFLIREGYEKVLLMHKDGRVKLVDNQGKDIPPCASNDGKRFIDIPGKDCRFDKIDFENATSIILLSRTGNPHGGNCPIIGGIPRC